MNVSGQVVWQGASSGEKCLCGQDAIEFLDFNGYVAMRFIRLCDGSFYGGRTHDDPALAWPPHSRLSLGALLGLVGQLARQEDTSAAYRVRWEIRRGYRSELIEREMNAARLAEVIGCAEQDVRAVFELLVKLA